MKISTDNGTIRNLFGDVKSTQMIAEAGFDGIDYTFYDIDKDNDILALPDAQRHALARDVLACAKDNGIVISQAHAPMAYRPEDTFGSKAYDDVIRSMEFAAMLECPQIVVHTIAFPREDRTIDRRARNLDFMRALLPYAEQFNINIGVENLFTRDKKRKCFFGRNGTPEELNSFIDELDNPRFVACCDLGHCALTGVEPEVFISKMDAKRLTMLHVHDTDYLSDSHTIPYLGKHDWEAITDAIAKIGFTGMMNLEVLHFYEEFPKELIPAALRMAAASARLLADKVEAKLGNV